MTAWNLRASIMDYRCVVTGATSGIGLAITHKLAADGYGIHALGRSKTSLEELARSCPGQITGHRVDLSDDEGIRTVARDLDEGEGGVRGLVHCAGVHYMGDMATEPVERLDEMYRVNLRAPYLLTQELLPAIKKARGWIVFLNSSAGNRAVRGIGAYSSTKHGLRALADSLRDEVNEQGIRVLSIYPGRTATPGMEKIFATEGRSYTPELLLQPVDVADLIAYALKLPESAELTDVHIRPSRKSY